MAIQNDWGDVSTADLLKLKVLHNVSPEAVEGILSSCELRSLEKGELLIEAGVVNEQFYFILDGELEVYVGDGITVEPILLHVGQTVGELSVIDHQASSAKVVAGRFCRVLVVPEAMFWRLIDVSHEFARNMLVLLSERMRVDNSLLHESNTVKKLFELQSTLDPLTGLHNRRWIEQNLPKLINRTLFGKEPLSIMMLDVDHFKKVNDTYGHLKGDSVLRFVSKIICDSIRPLDFACRFGGEEFLIIFPQTSLVNAMVPAERIRSQIEERTNAELGELGISCVTVTGGVATLERNHFSFSSEHLMEQLIVSADGALYRGKEAGRNRIIRG